jgi:hypothetical protein
MTIKATELSDQIRKYLNEDFDNIDGYSYEYLAKSLQEIERYYTGMVAWKKVAEEKDAYFANRKVKAYLVPKVLSFVGVRMTNCPIEMQEGLEGTIVHEVQIFSDGDGVVDKFGVKHFPIPLYE